MKFKEHIYGVTFIFGDGGEWWGVRHIFTYLKETLGPNPAMFVAAELGAFNKALGLLQQCFQVPQQVF